MNSLLKWECFIFRFRPLNENTLSELQGKYIWFSDRNSLNDELDSNPEFLKLSTNPEELKLRYNTIAENILDPIVKKYFDENMTDKKAPGVCSYKDKAFCIQLRYCLFYNLPDE